MKQGLGVCVLVLLFLSAISRAQTPTAVVNGQVRDTSGAAISGAMVEVFSDATHVRYSTKTNDEGIYSVPNLPPGTYHIQVSKAGFKTVIHPDISLNVQDAKAIGFALPVGSVSDTVTVEGGAPSIDTESAAVSTIVDRQFAENLPMNGRSFQTLIQLTPGVTLTPFAGADEGQFSVNGQRAASNYWMVDGVSANFGAANGANGQGEGIGGALPGFSVQGGTNSLVSVDALQEFRIQTSTYAPEFGRTPGGQISIVTRSGTNQFHGAAFDYLRNDVFDANDWFANFTKQRKPEERQNDFGGTFSGPILKNRTFFFFSYEGLRLRLPTVVESVVPSTAARQAAVAATQPILNAFPLPNGADLGDGTAQFNASFSNASTLDATSLRIDHRVSDNFTVFGRYNYSPSELLSRQGGTFSLSSLSKRESTIQTGTVGATWIISPAVTSELRFNYSRNTSDFSFSLDNFGGAVPLTPSALNLPAPFTTQNALFEVQIVLPSFLILPDGASGRFLQQQYNLVGNLSMQKGSHSFKVGADYRRLNPSYRPRQYAQIPLFLSIAAAESTQLLTSIITSVRHTTFELQNLSLFAQDTWRISSRLTLTYGLRWDVDFAVSSGPAFPALANFNPNALSNVSLAASGTAAYSTTYGNLAPRLGGAYQLSQRQGGETVFRGGIGVFYDLASGEVGNLMSSVLYPFGAIKFVPGSTYPLSSSQSAPPAIAVGNGVSSLDPNLKLPYTVQWNAALERALGTRQTISASYVGSFGRRLLQSADVFSPNPTFPQLVFLTNAATSDYHALQLQFQRRLSHGLQALASFTWSHSTDTASAGSYLGSNYANNFVPGINPDANRGPSDFDVRKAFSTGLTYDVPSPGRNGATKAVLGGWSVQTVVQARSALPINVYYDNFAFANALNATAAIRPDAVPGKALYLYGSECLQAPPAGLGAPCPGGKGFNPNAFMSPPVDANGNPIRQGNLPRNSLRGFGSAQWDFAVHRDFPIRESLKLQFRAEMFNILNHPNFASPVANLSSSQFGRSTQMLGQSLGGSTGFGGLDPLYQIGGPRSVQFALKLQF